MLEPVLRLTPYWNWIVLFDSEVEIKDSKAMKDAVVLSPAVLF